MKRSTEKKMLIGDGYNIMGGLGCFGKLGYDKGKGELKKKREKFLEFLTHLNKKQQKIILVFDGEFIGSRAPKRREKGKIKMIFTKRETADNFIKRTTAQEPGEFLVITNDRELRGNLEKMGVEVCSSASLLKRFRKVGKNLSQSL